MDISFENLNSRNSKIVKNIFIESFFQNNYFIGLFPNENTRIRDFERVVFPAINYCLKHNGAIAAICDGEICGYNLIAEYNNKNKNEFEQIFFAPYIDAGDKQLSVFRNKIREMCSRHGRVEYVYVGVIAKEFRRRGIGRKLNKHILESNKDKYIMTEITSTEMLALYNSFIGERVIEMEQLSDDYTVTTILPKANAAEISGGRK